MSSVWKKTQQVQKRLFARKQQKEIPHLIRKTEKAIFRQNILYSRFLETNSSKVRSDLEISTLVWNILCSDCKRKCYRVSEIEFEIRGMEARLKDARRRMREKMNLEEEILDLAEVGEGIQDIMEDVKSNREFEGLEREEDYRRMGMIIDDIEYGKWVKDQKLNLK